MVVLVVARSTSSLFGTKFADASINVLDFSVFLKISVSLLLVLSFLGRKFEGIDTELGFRKLMVCERVSFWLFLEAILYFGEL